MRISHRLALDSSDLRRLEKLGIQWREYALDAAGTVLVVYEDDAGWGTVRQMIGGRQVLDVVDTEFSSNELAQAHYLSVLSKSFSGYPQPEDDFGYLGVSYDLSDYCAECGIGARQKAPLRIDKEPNWGRRATFQVHWIFDELFVKKDVWKPLADRFGIDIWPVHSRSGKELETVAQLKFEEIAELVMPPEHPTERCRKCARVRQIPFSRGFWPRPADVPKRALFKSSQYFGSGYAADRAIFVNQELYQAMKMAKMNCRFWAVTP